METRQNSQENQAKKKSNYHHNLVIQMKEWYKHGNRTEFPRKSSKKKSIPRYAILVPGLVPMPQYYCVGTRSVRYTSSLCGPLYPCQPAKYWYPTLRVQKLMFVMDPCYGQMQRVCCFQRCASRPLCMVSHIIQSPNKSTEKLRHKETNNSPVKRWSDNSLVKKWCINLFFLFFFEKKNIIS